MSARWKQVPPELLEELAGRFKSACILALAQLRAEARDEDDLLRRFPNIYMGIMIGLAQELRDLGCPEREIRCRATEISAHALIPVGLAALPAAGNA